MCAYNGIIAMWVSCYLKVRYATVKCTLLFCTNSGICKPTKQFFEQIVSCASNTVIAHVV